MAKIKKVSITAFDKIVDESYVPSNSIEWHGIELIIKRTLSFSEMMTFVNKVVQTCFSEEDGTYLPEVRDFMINSCVLEMYGNFAIPSNIEHLYSLIYCSDAVQTVLGNVNRFQFDEIVDAIDRKIEYLAQSHIDTITKQAEALYASVENLQQQLADVFSGVKAEDMKKMIGAISNSQIDEEKLVAAYIDQKRNIDTDGNTGDE